MNKNQPLDCLTCSTRSESIFSETDSNDLTVLSNARRCMSFRKGEMIYAEGGIPHGLFCIHAGTVKILRTGDSGRESIVRLVGAGAVIGYRALLSGEAYDNTAVALADCNICQIPRSRFIDLVSQRPELSGRVLALLSSELKSAEERVLDIAQKPVVERVAETLLILLESFGFADDGETLNLEITREELAGMVGAVPESTIRALSRLRSDGLIDVRRRHISILDRRGLTDAAGLAH